MGNESVEERLDRLEKENQQLKQIIKKHADTNDEAQKQSNNQVSRRDFLKKLGAGALGLGALSLTPSSALNIRSDNLQFYGGPGENQVEFEVDQDGNINTENTLNMGSNKALWGDFEIRPSQNENEGLAVRANSNPNNSDPIFTVESSGEATRLAVTQGNGTYAYDELYENASNGPGSGNRVATRNWVNNNVGGGAQQWSYTSPGSHTWNKPADINVVYVELVGGGGGGAAGGNGGGGGGGGGGAFRQMMDASQLSSQVSVEVGAGGNGGGSYEHGSGGGNTSISDITVGGGGGGYDWVTRGDSNNYAGGSGGSGFQSGGNGGSGGDYSANNGESRYFAAGGGGGGGNPDNSPASGGSSPAFGAGGSGGSTGSDGSPGEYPGGGGGGSGDGASGGDGADGRVRIWAW